ncbi:hypothetical protein ACMGDM_20165 [Sphingomonas sp. DT-51]|uniref:hypothetical protein n=1 Tax=Sphingomonas sp. DT-51 TaxID=3396165 RepID=UPI003F1ABCCF
MASVPDYRTTASREGECGSDMWGRSYKNEKRWHSADRDERRGKVAILSAALTFVGLWIYSGSAFGGLGAILGWVPAAPLAVLTGTLLFHMWRPAAAVVMAYLGYTAAGLILRLLV